MNIIDKVYGLEKVEEPVLIELIDSSAVQRLKGVSQQDVPYKYNTQPFFSRYDHSIGVMILLRRLNASLKEQIARLLHDISHPAFSHLFDWVVGNPKTQQHQDNQYFSVLNNSDVPAILIKQGFDVRDFYNLEEYSLLEQNIPELCADRIDYCLRDLVANGGDLIANHIIKHLMVYGKLIVFDSSLVAYEFSHEFISLQRFSWGNDTNVARFHVFADVLRRALQERIISEDDFLGIDENIMKKLENSGDSKIKESLGLLRSGFYLKYCVSNGIQLQCKFRYVDPCVFCEGALKKLSEIFPPYSGELDLQRNHFENIRCVEVLPR